MSNVLFEGDFEARQTKPEFGGKKGKPFVRVEMEITSDGPHKGRRLTFEGKLDTKNIKYTKQYMIALGWQGKTSGTFVADVTKANLTVPVQVRIASFEREDGTVRQWSSIDKIGRMTAPLDALDADQVRDVDGWFAEAGDVGAPAGGGSNGYNGGGYGGGGGQGAPPPGDDDIPFAHADATCDPSPIARTLR